VGTSGALHCRYGLAEFLNCIPVGELNDGRQICRSFGHPHDKPDRLPIQKAILRIIDLSSEYAQRRRLPGNLFKKLLQVRIGGRLILLGLSSYDIDCEECQARVHG
jgi:hypothetical protein